MTDLPPLTEAPSPLTEAEIVAVLEALTRGEVTIPEHEHAAVAEQYNGDFDFHLSNGWTFTVFNDCDEWDYLARVRAPDGRTLGFDELDEMPRVQAYEPPAGLWGIDR